MSDEPGYTAHDLLSQCGNCKRQAREVRWIGYDWYCTPCYDAYWDLDDTEDRQLKALRLDPLPDDEEEPNDR